MVTATLGHFGTMSQMQLPCRSWKIHNFDSPFKNMQFLNKSQTRLVAATLGHFRSMSKMRLPGGSLKFHNFNSPLEKLRFLMISKTCLVTATLEPQIAPSNHMRNAATRRILCSRPMQSLKHGYT